MRVLLKRAFLMALSVVGASVFLSACSSDGDKRPEYMDAYSMQALEIPPRLTKPDTGNAVKLPEPANRKNRPDCN
ncbi:hypothetical protein MNBD_GAMMA10-284 [hydrothermal vent metagenome]|uniref:Lipoprotein n=1 Tax=hydrothermal vent metagenome TaxID=652676 RepID=A0A3B0XZS9_9ZZZZ